MQARLLWPRYLGLLIFLGASCSKVEVSAPRGNVSEKKFVVDAQSARPTKKFGSNAPFLNLSETSGLSDYRANQISMVDFDGDGWLDMSVLEGNYSRPKILRYHPESGQFLQTFEDPFPDNFLGASYVVYFDYNKDGILDALSGAFVLGNKNLVQLGLNLYQGSKEKGQLHFSKQNFPALDFAPSTISFLDYNLDGFIDIYVGQFGTEVQGRFYPGIDLIFKGDGRGFSQVNILEGEKKVDINTNLVGLNAVPTWSSFSCDVNNDGYPDILVAAASGYPNRLWINQGGKNFIDQGAATNFANDFVGIHKISGGGRNISTMCGDLNQDGLMDTILGEMNYSYDNEELDRSSLLLQEKLVESPYFRFNRIEFSRTEQGTSGAVRRIAVADLNLDGAEEIVLEDNGFPPYTRLKIFKDDAQKEMAADLGVDLMNPQSIVLADVNGDYKLDLLMGQSLERNPTLKSQVHYFKNNHTTGSSIYKIKLHPQKSNFENQGVKIVAHFFDGIKTRKFYKTISSIYGSVPVQHESAIYLSAREKEKLQKVEVFWAHTSFKNKSVSYTVNVSHPKVLVELFESGKKKISRR